MPRRSVFITAPVAASLFAVVLLGAQCRGSEPGGPLQSATPAAAPAAARPPDDGLTESEFAGRLPGIDPTGLTPKQRSDLSDLANDTFCPCAPMTVAGCVREVPSCRPATRLVELAKKMIVAGRPAATVLLHVEAYYGSFATERRREVPAAGPRKGAPEGKVTIVEFSDFECPACRAAHPALEAAVKAYPDKVTVVFKNFPLPMHTFAAPAAAAGEYAFEKGRFWPFADQLFENQQNLGEAGIKAHAKAAGLDPEATWKAASMPTYVDRVNADVAEGNTLQVTSTPTLFINGRQNLLPATPDYLAWTIDDELEWLGRGRSWAGR
jgi:protein-disulfide isomerase